MAAGKGERQDEPADHEKQMNAKIAREKQANKPGPRVNLIPLRGQIYWSEPLSFREIVSDQMMKDNGHYRDETQPIDLRNKFAGRRNSGKSLKETRGQRDRPIGSG